VLAFAPAAPVCLVGYGAPQSPSEIQITWETATSKDEEDDERRIVSMQEGQDAACQIGAVAYIEWTGGLHGEMAKVVQYGYYYRLLNSAE
jgi:hypothetical protein